MMNRALCTLALLVAAGLAYGGQDDPPDALRALPAPVARVVKGRVLAVERARPRFTIPFVRAGDAERVAIVHEITAVEGKPSIAMRSLFSDTGAFLGAQSLATTPDPRRMSIDVLETGLTRMGVTVALPSTPHETDLDAIWRAVARRVPLDEIREFDLYRVDYTERGTRRPAVIVNVWGPANPLDMPDELPEVLKNRIRFIYFLDDGTWEADNLL